MPVNPEWEDVATQAAGFGALGILIGLGQLLASKEQLTLRIIFGRCLSTVGLAMSAGSVLLAFPEIPFIAQLGVASALASLGTSGLERFVQRVFGVRGE